MNTREGILEDLLLAGPAGASGEALCRRAGISRAAVWKHIQALQRQGYGIEGKSGVGYHLAQLPDRLDGPLLQHFLHTRALGRTVRSLEEIDSTNLGAKAWAAEGAPHGAIVLAERQTQGRGRKGRGWYAPAGEGLWMSLVLRPEVPPERVQSLTLLTAVAVALGVETVCPPLAAHIKWPNDVQVDGRKICGILTEVVADMDGVEYVVPGIGINCHMPQAAFPDDLQDKATSLAAAGSPPFLRVQLAAAVLMELERLLDAWQQGDFAAVVAGYRSHMAYRGSLVTVSGPGWSQEGRIVDVDDQGQLILEDDAGRRQAVRSGEVTVRRKEPCDTQEV